MKEFLKENKSTIVSHFAATLGGLVLAGIVGTALGEQLGYASGVLYLYGLQGHRRVVELLKKRIK